MNGQSWLHWSVQCDNTARTHKWKSGWAWTEFVCCEPMGQKWAGAGAGAGAAAGAAILRKKGEKASPASGPPEATVGQQVPKFEASKRPNDNGAAASVAPRLASPRLVFVAWALRCRPEDVNRSAGGGLGLGLGLGLRDGEGGKEKVKWHERRNERTRGSKGKGICKLHADL